MKPHLVGPHAEVFRREDYPDERCYSVVLCRIAGTGHELILCRMHH